MKSFNKISAALLALPLMAAFTACEDEADYTAATLEEGAKVFFATSNPANVSLAHETGSSFDVLLSRSNASDAVTVPLTISCSKSGVFTYPTEASFAAGNDKATLTISYDGLQLDYEEVVDFSIKIAEEYQSLYSISNYSFSAMIPAPWVSMGKAIYQDDCMASLYGAPMIKYEVEIEEYALEPGIFRLVNPYGEGYPYNDPGDWYDGDYYLQIDATDPDHVWFSEQHMGVEWSGEGELIMTTFIQYYMDRGETLEGLKESDPDLFGTYKNGVITMPAQSILLALGEDGYYYGNPNGGFLIAMPGVVLADYTAEVAYAGKYYDADDNLYIAAEVVSLGADVEEVRLAVAAPDEVENVVAAIAAEETEDYVSLSGTGTASLPFDANAASGKYSIVAVTFAGGEAQEANSVNFKYTSMSGEPEETWTPLFFGDYEYSLVFGTPEEPEYDLDLVLYQSDNDPSRYKIAHWLMDVDFIFTMDNEGNCTVLEDQETGYVDGGDMILFEELGLYAETDQMGWSFYENGVFYFNIIYYVEDGYYGYGYETFTLTAEYSEESAARGQHKAVAATEKHAVKSAKHKKTTSALRCLKKNAIRLN